MNPGMVKLRPFLGLVHITGKTAKDNVAQPGSPAHTALSSEAFQAS
jgi:hypothetical protein